MKKIPAILLTIFLIITLTAGCSSNTTQSSADSSETVSKNQDNSIDLTSFDSISASDIAHRISENPREYLGVSMKIRGHYESADNHNTGDYIHAVVVDNDTQCCPATIEFIWNGKHSYPKDYPKEYEKIEVEGILKSYKEKGATYYYLAIDDISVLS